MMMEASSSRTGSTRPVLLLLTGATVFVATANAQVKCYNTWGQEDENLQPCFTPEGSDATAWCCDSKDSCLSNGLCISHESSNLLTQQGCTDKDWGGSCKRFCSASNVEQDRHRIPLVGCPASFDNKTNSIQYCCGPDPARCCENSISWFSVPAGTLIRPPTTTASPSTTSPAPATTADPSTNTPSTDTTTSDSSVRTLGLGIGLGVGIPIFLVLLAIAFLLAAPRKLRFRGRKDLRRDRSRSRSRSHSPDRPRDEKYHGASPTSIAGRHELGSLRRHELATSVHSGANPLPHEKRRQEQRARERDLKTAASFGQLDTRVVPTAAAAANNSTPNLVHQDSAGSAWPGQAQAQTASQGTAVPTTPSPAPLVSTASGSSATLLSAQSGGAGGGGTPSSPKEMDGDGIMMVMGKEGGGPGRWGGSGGKMPVELDSGVPVGGYGVYGQYSNVYAGQGAWDWAASGQPGVRVQEEELNSPTLGRDVEMALPVKGTRRDGGHSS
ncbi:hypothetical protein VTJ49DRAFT_3597 [Mycothermus thermophilus]|uniref:Uncharacterized protein n=1 Tax=Humicola insolens TaxID=85995 RepID=A0ABR3VPT6_HUMIN